MSEALKSLEIVLPRLAWEVKHSVEHAQDAASLHVQSLHDSLTGLPNRSLLTEQLTRAIAQRKRNEDYKFSLFFLNLDGFKLINDRLGYAAGDQLLVEIAQRLQSAVRGQDCVARFDGDQFVILLHGVGTAQKALSFAKRVHTLVSMPVQLGSTAIEPGVSIGIMVNTMGHKQATDILRDADLALYQAKAQGGACSVVFSSQPEC